MGNTNPVGNNYIAITIGPIYKTFLNVRKTRELWAASYIFSLISKQLIEIINSADPAAVFIPFYDDKAPKGIGLFPDRVFLQSESITLNDIDGYKEQVYIQLSKVIDAVPGNSDSFDFLVSYFRIYAVSYGVDPGDNPLRKGNHLLDTAELRSGWQLEEAPNQLLKFFRYVNTLKVDGHKWIQAHLEQSEMDVMGQVRFESMIEIATRALRDIDRPKYKELVKKYCYDDGEKDEQEDAFVEELKRALNRDDIEVFKNYHKYVCVVKADGDRLGKYINAIDGNFASQLGQISKGLYDWGIATSKLIRQYLGVPIYVGGDDLLFLAPVVGHAGENILELCESINEDFKSRFVPKETDEHGLIQPTLSVGVSITYYKYPLSEALKKADDLLHKAKTDRNTICVSHLKHSGTSMDITVPMDEGNAIRNTFNDLKPKFESDASFVSALIHHFREHEPVYRELKGSGAKINNYLMNSFDSTSLRDTVEKTAAFVVSIIEKHRAIDSARARSVIAMQEVFSSLRILKFLNGHDDGK